METQKPKHEFLDGIGELFLKRQPPTYRRMIGFDPMLVKWCLLGSSLSERMLQTVRDISVAHPETLDLDQPYTGPFDGKKYVEVVTETLKEAASIFELMPHSPEEIKQEWIKDTVIARLGTSEHCWDFIARLSILCAGMEMLMGIATAATAHQMIAKLPASEQVPQPQENKPNDQPTAEG